MDYITLAFRTKAVDPENGIYELMPSAESEDREGDILLAVGAQLDDFRRNPVVMYAHDYRDLPVAKALAIDPIPGKGLKATIQFPPRGISERADTVHAMWAAGFLNAASVGFIPKTFQNKPGPDGVVPAQNEYPRYGRIFTGWDLLEFSIVPVPANADALRLAAKHLEPGKVDQKRGRVLSAANEQRIRQAVAGLSEVLSQLDQNADGGAGEDDGKGTPAPGVADQADEGLTADESSEFAASLAELMSVIREVY